jgi:hypothetical protein
MYRISEIDNKYKQMFRQMFFENFLATFPFNQEIVKNGISILYEDDQVESEDEFCQELTEIKARNLYNYLSKMTNGEFSSNSEENTFPTKYDQLILLISNRLSKISDIKPEYCKLTNTFYFSLISLFLIFRNIKEKQTKNTMQEQIFVIIKLNMQKIKGRPLPTMIETLIKELSLNII